ncbi:retrovirus-related pol polyprotein from transposon TNT 1-94 [Tanacetum coccineum]
MSAGYPSLLRNYELKCVKKNSKRKVWKATEKVFTNIGYIWRPTGRTFTIVGNVCPLTRITTTTEVPLMKSSALGRPNCPLVFRDDRTLIKVARTMLIYAKAPLFLWAEAVATACYTQNRSMIRRRHGKTPYELLHNKPPDLSYLHVFGALCYLTNDNENLGKLQPKADIGRIKMLFDSILLIEAMQEEPLMSSNELEVWELVPRPHNVMVITLKWIYKVKLDEMGGILKNKARLVARGYRQEEGIDFEESLLHFEIRAIMIFSRASLNLKEIGGFDSCDPVEYSNVVRNPNWMRNKEGKAVDPVTTTIVMPDQLVVKNNSVALLPLPDRHLLSFHDAVDARSLWKAIKARFGGNEASKKMQKNLLKQQFEILRFGIESSNSMESDISSGDETLTDSAYENFKKRKGLQSYHIHLQESTIVSQEGQSRRRSQGTKLSLTVDALKYDMRQGQTSDLTKPLTQHPPPIEAIKSLEKMKKCKIFKSLQISLSTCCQKDLRGQNHERRSTSGGCQYSWKKTGSWQARQTNNCGISSTEAEYVAAASSVVVRITPLTPSMLEVVTALAAEEEHSTSPHSRAASSARDAQGTPTQSAAHSQRTASVQGTASFQGTATSQGTAEIQRTADFQGTAEPHDAASIPKSPNDYTPTDASQTSGGDEGLLDIYALNREVKRLKRQTLSQAKQIIKLKAKLKKLSKFVQPVVKHHAFWVERQNLKKQKRRRKKQKKKVSSVKMGRNKDEGTLSEEHNVQEEDTAHPFFDDIVDKDAADLERKSDETEEVNIEEKEASNVKSGDTEELDLEITQSTARQSTITPRTLNFEDEAGPSSPLRPIQVMESEEQLEVAEVLVAISRPRGLNIPGPIQTQPQQPTQGTDPKDKGKYCLNDKTD